MILQSMSLFTRRMASEFLAYTELTILTIIKTYHSFETFEPFYLLTNQTLSNCDATTSRKPNTLRPLLSSLTSIDPAAIIMFLSDGQQLREDNIRELSGPSSPIFILMRNWRILRNSLDPNRRTRPVYIRIQS